MCETGELLTITSGAPGRRGGDGSGLEIDLVPCQRRNLSIPVGGAHVLSLASVVADEIVVDDEDPIPIAVVDALSWLTGG